MTRRSSSLRMIRGRSSSVNRPPPALTFRCGANDDVVTPTWRARSIPSFAGSGRRIKDWASRPPEQRPRKLRRVQGIKPPLVTGPLGVALFETSLEGEVKNLAFPLLFQATSKKQQYVLDSFTNGGQ